MILDLKDDILAVTFDFTLRQLKHREPETRLCCHLTYTESTQGLQMQVEVA